MHETYPPNWDQRPRVEPWNGHISREGWEAKTHEELVGIIALLNAQVTKAQQDARDATFPADWAQFRVLREVRIGARLYVAVTKAHRKGRKTVRVDDLLAESRR